LFSILQEAKIESLEETANNLVKENHYDSVVIKERIDSVMKR